MESIIEMLGLAHAQLRAHDLPVEAVGMPKDTFAQLQAEASPLWRDALKGTPALRPRVLGMTIYISDRVPPDKLVIASDADVRRMLGLPVL